MTARRLFLSIFASLAAHALVVSLIGMAPITAKENKEAVIMVELQEEPNKAVPAKTLSSVVDDQPVTGTQTASKAGGLLLQSQKLTTYRSYLAKVKARIERFWNFHPAAIQGRPDAVTVIRFVIDASGSLLHRVVETSSGSDHLDRLSLEAVQNAAPFEAIPADLRLPKLQVVARFKYHHD